MPSAWPALPYDAWSATCDTLHAHAQVLGKLSSKLGPPEPQFQHGALRLTARGWETRPLPAPDGSGIFGVALDLHAHEAIVEHGDGRIRRVPLTPNRSVAEVTGGVLGAVTELVGAVKLNLKPQETAWDTPLDQDEEHATYNPEHVATYLAAAGRATTVLAALRAPYRGRETPVNAWWGSFDFSVNLFSGHAAAPPSDGFIERNAMDSQEIAVGWWPGDGRYPRAAFYGYAYPSPEGLSTAELSPTAARWDATLGEFILDWDDVIATPDPFQAALDFGRSVVHRACVACEWDPTLAASFDSTPPPVV